MKNTFFFVYLFCVLSFLNPVPKAIAGNSGSENDIDALIANEIHWKWKNPSQVTRSEPLPKENSAASPAAPDLAIAEAAWRDPRTTATVSAQGLPPVRNEPPALITNEIHWNWTSPSKLTQAQPLPVPAEIPRLPAPDLAIAEAAWRDPRTPAPYSAQGLPSVNAETKAENSALAEKCPILDIEY